MIGAAIFQAYARAFGQLTDRRLRRPLLVSILASVAAFALLEAALAATLLGGATTGSSIADWLVGAVGTVGIVILGCFLFPAVVLLMLGLFIEQAVRAVEARWYPGLPPPRRQPPGELVASAVRVSLLSLVVSVTTLLLGILLPGINLFLFYGLNGYVLAREYFELVAFRRLDPVTARALWQRHRVAFIFLGAPIAFLLTVPIANLVAPLVAAAAMVHLFERLRIVHDGPTLPFPGGDRGVNVAGRRERVQRRL